MRSKNSSWEWCPPVSSNIAGWEIPYRNGGFDWGFSLFHLSIVINWYQFSIFQHATSTPRLITRGFFHVFPVWTHLLVTHLHRGGGPESRAELRRRCRQKNPSNPSFAARVPWISEQLGVSSRWRHDADAICVQNPSHSILLLGFCWDPSQIMKSSPIYKGYNPRKNHQPTEV